MSWRLDLIGDTANECAEALRDAAELLSRPGETWGRVHRSRMPCGSWWVLSPFPEPTDDTRADLRALLTAYLESRSAPMEEALLTAIVAALEDDEQR